MAINPQNRWQVKGLGRRAADILGFAITVEEPQRWIHFNR